MSGRPFLRRFLPAFFLASVGLFSAVASVDAHARHGNDAVSSFFGTVEWRAATTGPFRKWWTVLERAAEERQRARTDGCTPTLFRGCPYQAWLTYLERLRSLDKHSQMTLVNGYVNRVRYITDRTNWGVSDYWASPGEFLENEGDCEDFAIAKYLSLRELGWRQEDLRVVTVFDVDARRGHAVLIASHGGRKWLLDNAFKRVFDTSAVNRYRPVYSVNEAAVWLHKSR